MGREGGGGGEEGREGGRGDKVKAKVYLHCPE